jgi:hypothetical protein
MRYLYYLVATVLFTAIAHAASGDGSLPDPGLTPGAIRSTDTAAVCAMKTREVRRVSETTKASVRRSYGMAGRRDLWCNTPQGCEIDHLIPLGIGGSNDTANLWPQAYQGPHWNAHLKDRLESKLRKLVCSGKVDMREAQRDVANNWIDAYRKYMPMSEPRNVQVPDFEEPSD